MDPAAKKSLNPQIGLCELCKHSVAIRSERGSVFYLCELSKTDRTFAKYPRLPVIDCPGFVEKEFRPS